jgi:hypothetical protein
MNNLMSNPTYWRKRAEETRAKADSFVHRASRESLLKIAEEYDRLARHAEQVQFQLAQ